MEKKIGIIETIEKITEHKFLDREEKTKTLYATHLIIDGKKYSISDYSKQALEKRINALALRDKIEFLPTQNKKGYWVIDTAYQIKVLNHCEPKKIVESAPAKQKTLLAFSTDEQIVEQTKKLSNGLLSDLNPMEAKEVIETRKLVFQELMKDRRTKMIKED